jgi:hypothetical protein
MWSLLSAEGGVTMVAVDKVGSSACPAVWLSTIFRAKSFTDCTFERDLSPFDLLPVRQQSLPD